MLGKGGGGDEHCLTLTTQQILRNLSNYDETCNLKLNNIENKLIVTNRMPVTHPFLTKRALKHMWRTFRYLHSHFLLFPC